MSVEVAPKFVKIWSVSQKNPVQTLNQFIVLKRGASNNAGIQFKLTVKTLPILYE
jgi:hypothetical protein